MPPLLEALDLVREFGPVRAVDGISFHLAEGEVLAVFGPNGAGKSTLLGLLGGTLRPDAGEILLRGEPRDPRGTEWRREVGVLSHRSFLYQALSATENLRFYGRLYGVADLAARVRTALVEVGLSGEAHRPVRGFSRGMRQRLALARTLLHDPTLVLLDEPFTGLDLHAATLLRDVLMRLRDGRRTVVLVTHNLREGLSLADRIAIQSRGRFAFLGDRSELPQGEEEAFYRTHVDETGPLVVGAAAPRGGEDGGPGPA